MSEPFFSSVVESLLEGRQLAASRCMSFHFASQTMRVWTGFGLLRTSDGQEWQGLGDLGDLGALQLGGLPTEQVTARLTGLENFIPGGGAEIAAMLDDAENEIEGRLARLWLVFFDPSAENGWKPVTAPYVMRSFFMGVPVVDIDLARREGTHNVELPLEPRTVDKHRNNAEILGHINQLARYPGDLALERMGKIAGTGRVEW